MRLTATSEEPLRLRFTIEIELLGVAAADVVEVPRSGVDGPRGPGIPSHVDVVPEKVAFTVSETAVWLGFMEHGEPAGSAVYHAATQRVRRLIQRGELKQRALGGRSYLIPGEAIREYLASCGEPIAAPSPTIATKAPPERGLRAPQD